VKKLRRLHEQSGQALAIVLVLLLVGSLLVTSTLKLGSSSFKIQSHAKQETSKLYSADLGTQQALWRLKNTPYANLPTNPLIYIDVPSSGIIEGNGISVFAFIQYVGTFDELRRYRITSIAGPNVTHDHDLDNQAEGYTKIVSIVLTSSGDLSGIMNSSITSQNGYTIQGGQGSVSPTSGEHAPVANYSGIWPTGSQLHQFFWQQVDDTVPGALSSIDVTSTPTLDNYYRDGNLDIESSTDGATITLTGTLFLNGNLQIGTTGHNFTLNLNGQTIYVNSNTIGSPYALQIGAKCTVVGSGAVIALGDIQFKPNINSNPSEYLLVMSVTGMSYLQPGGDYYGTVAGSTTVYDQNGSITWVDPSGKSLNLPGIGSGTFWSIKTWDITLH
jgi:hypothetical protein